MFYFINSQVSNQKTPFNTTFFDCFRNSKIDVPKSAIRNFREKYEHIFNQSSVDKDSVSDAGMKISGYGRRRGHEIF